MIHKRKEYFDYKKVYIVKNQRINMKLREIHDKMHLAHTYKYVAQLELEKNKRKNGVYHDFNDSETFYTEKVKEYDDYLKRLQAHKTDKIEKMFRVTAVAVNLALILVFVKMIA